MLYALRPKLYAKGSEKGDSFNDIEKTYCGFMLFFSAYPVDLLCYGCHHIYLGAEFAERL